jgi:hypothetical protein
VAFDGDVAEAAALEAERDAAADRDGVHAGHGAQALHHARVVAAAFGRGVAGREQIDPADDDALGLEPWRHARGLAEAADAETRADQQ